MTATQQREATTTKSRRNPAPFVAATVLTLLAGYYLIVVLVGALDTSTRVPVTGRAIPHGTDYLRLDIKLQTVDLPNRVVKASVLPVPHGSFVGAKPGEMSRSVRIEVSNAGTTSLVGTYPARSVVDPTPVSVDLDRGDTAYPFDRPFTSFTLSVRDELSGRLVPATVRLDNAARPWTMSASIAEQNGDGYALTLTAHREALNVALVLFYVLAILLTTLIAVVLIGSALIRNSLEFSNVIWLSATLLSFPALRSAMPGAPPIGTALDFIVFFPCVCLIAVLVIWTGLHLLRRETITLRELRRSTASRGGDE